MTVARLYNTRQQFLNNSGTPLASGRLFFYLAGTTTKTTTYNSSTGVTANSNPITLDSNGRPTVEIWVDGTTAIKVGLAAIGSDDPPAAFLWTEDNIRANGYSTTSMPTVFDYGGFTAGQVADVTSFTGSVDVTTQLNTAFAYAANNNLAIRMPAGKYKITDTLQLTPVGSTFKSFHIIGDGGGYSSSNYQVYIDATAVTTKPAINMQLVRGGYLSGVFIQGPNIAPKNLSVANQEYGATWVTTGCRDSQWSPNCGICVDGGVGTTPSDSGYSGFTYRSLASGSSRITFEDVGIDSFVVGYMINAEANGVQCDQITIRNPQINSVKVGIAVGTSQARCVTVYSGNISNFRDAYSGLTYGKQQGASARMNGTQLGPGYEVFNYGSGFGSFSLTEVRTEQVHRIGYASGGSSYPIVLTDCDFALVNSADCGPPPILLETLGTVTMIGGRVGVDGTYTDSLNFIAQYLKCEGTIFWIKNRFRPYIYGSQDFNNETVLRNITISDGTSLRLCEERKLASLSGRLTSHYSEPIKQDTTARYEVVPGKTNNYTNVATASAFVFGATTLTFNLTTTTDILVDDILLWKFLAVGPSGSQYTLPGLKVTTIVGTTITCNLLHPLAYYDQTYAPASIGIAMHEWAPLQALTGDTTSASTALANVSPTTILKNGDWIKGPGLASNSRVVSGGGTASITLNRNATASITGTNLYWGQLCQLQNYGGLNATVSFSVHRNGSNQTGIATAVATKVQLTTEEFDVGSYFDNATNYRWTPLVAGKYIVSWRVEFLVGVDQTYGAIGYLYKNGSLYKQGSVNAESGVGAASSVGSLTVSMNGTTDYLEVFGYQSSGGNQDINGAASSTYFAAAYLGA